MLIEIPDDLKEYILELDDIFSDEILALNTIFDSMVKNHHIVFASLDMLEMIKSHAYISIVNKYYIEWILSRRVELYSGVKDIKTRVILTQDDTISKLDNNFYVPLKKMKDLKETAFVSEHEDDAIFYSHCFNIMCDAKKISGAIGLSLENNACHGSNVGAKMKQIAKDNRFIICLLDSDRKYPNCEYGSTYKGANNAYKKLRNSNVIGLEVLELHEKENLLPPDSYMEFIQDEKTKEMLVILSEFVDQKNIYGYFDIKDGIKNKRLRDDMWRENFKPLVERLIEEDIVTTNEEVLKDDERIIDGVGGAVSAKAIQKFSSIDEVKLPKYMYSEWERIFEILFSWGCAVSKDNRPLGKISE